MKKIYNKTTMVIAALLFASVASLFNLNAQTMTNYGGWGMSATALVDGLNGPGNQWGGPTAGAWAQFQFSSAQTWNAYAITSGVSGANATAWTVSGSNDGSAWTVLDTQSGISWSGNNQVKNFTFSNSTAYLYYKLDVTGDDTGWGFFIGEFTFSFDTAVQIPEHKMNSLLVKTTASKSSLVVEFGKQLSNEKVTLFDMKGSRVFETNVNGTSATLNISNLKNGVYVVKTSSGVARFIK